MLKLSPRALVLTLAVVSLAVLAGVMAVRAFASTATYCNACTLKSSGVPAVSASRSTYSMNFIYTSGYADEQIYNYGDGTTQCSAQSNHVTTLTIFCHPWSSTATARCHLIHGTGPETAFCEATY